MMTWQAQHRGDFLTMPFRGSVSGWWSGKKYFRASAKIRAEFRAEVKAHGYTRIYFDVHQLLAGRDYVGAPAALVPFLQECVADGLGPVVFIIPEDDDKLARTRYGLRGDGQVGATFYTALKHCAKLWGPYVADWVGGVEIDSIVGDRHADKEAPEFDGEANITKIMTTLRTALLALPPKRQPPRVPYLWAHFSTGWHGRWPWWKKQAWAKPGGLAYQYNKADMNKPGFCSSLAQIREETMVYSGRLKTAGGGRAFCAGEHTWERPESKAIACGDEALRRGAIAAMNGCSGV